MGGDSLRPFLKMQNIFVRDIPRSAPALNVKAALEKIGGSACKVVLPLDYNSGKQMGQAYLNFNTVEEARRLLDKHRFGVTFEGQLCKVMFAAKNTQADKDRVYGPYSYKFQVIVKNLSETVDTPRLFELMTRWGEVYQCKVDYDAFGQYYGQVTYIDEDSVAKAVAGANGMRWDSSVIQVDPHHKAHLAASAAPAGALPPEPSSSAAFPALGVGAAAAAAAATGAAPSPSRAAAAAPSPSRAAAGAPVAAAAANGNAGSSSGGPGSRLQVYCPPDQLDPALRGGFPSSNTSTPVNFAVQALGGQGGTPPSALPSTTSAPGGSAAVRSQTGLGLLPSPCSAADEAAASTALDMARLVLSDSGSSTTGAPSPAAGPQARAASGNSAAAAIASAAGLGGGPLMDLLARRRAAATPPASAGSGGMRGGLPLPALVHGLSPAGPTGPQTKGRGTLKSMMQALDQVSELLCCPISHEPFVDPVVAADGVTYERAAIKGWLSNHDTSPMTNVVLPNRELHPNNLARALVQELL